MEFTKQATAAAWHALRNTQVKGRSEARLHAAVTRGIKAAAMRPRAEDLERLAKLEKVEVKDLAPALIDREIDNFQFVGGTVVLNDLELGYLNDVVTDQLDAGVAGEMGRGYGELVDILEKAN
jgi:formate dehydrogenase maturation protein FdhE